MAKSLLLVHNKKPVGIFTQLKKIYGAIERLEGREVTEKCEEMSNLMIPFKEPKTLNYARLTKFISDHGRVALFPSNDLENPRYTVFLFEINHHPLDNEVSNDSEDSTTDNSNATN